MTQAIVGSIADCLLHAENNIHTLCSTLELVQSLIVLHIRTSLSRSVCQSQYGHAGAYFSMLSFWTGKLFFSAPSAIPAIFTPHQAWILGESIRRTLLMSFMAQGVYTCMRRGYFHLTLFQVALPVNRAARQWNEGLLAKEQLVDLVSYRELGDLFECGEALGEDCPFEDLLLIACKGLQRVRLQREAYRRV
jgi:hypothetical protein